MHSGSLVVGCEQTLIVGLSHFQQKSHHGGLLGTRLARRHYVNAMGRRHDASDSTTPNSKIDTKTMIDHLARKWRRQRCLRHDVM